MKKSIIFISAIFLLSFTTKKLVTNTSILIVPESTLIVKGKTNVNKFDCIYNIQKIKNPIPVFFEMKENKMVFENTELVLENECFDCGNKMINKDFQDLLKSKTHPDIFLKLKELEKLSENDSVYHANLELEIAGKTKDYQIAVVLEQEKDLIVKGILLLNICDFNIEPPKKFLGIITVNEIIEINFQLLITES
ncbi:YceI family protein [Thalassobellus suaedae]|uniref:Lipid/polyisoprenoid-binding YceI-like domain-containing protein n=1 Tax=Thalassobellus suaedae TaxID=3074124 RepID=A0ABY9Y2X9_9FLAO|nr:hypothetical protein RHP49_16300 [Flavobacteriaceae bacterium HL-DH10]